MFAKCRILRVTPSFNIFSRVLVNWPNFDFLFFTMSCILIWLLQCAWRNKFIIINCVLIIVSHVGREHQARRYTNLLDERKITKDIRLSIACNHKRYRRYDALCQVRERIVCECARNAKTTKIILSDVSIPYLR